jgi:hypothetical protein
MAADSSVYETIAFCESKHPGKGLGLLGNVGGSWRRPTDWSCSCGETRRIVVWETPPIKYCAGCTVTRQLTLFGD